MKCKDCGCEINTEFLIDGEVVTCPSCGSEYSYSNGSIESLVYEGEDWGE